MLKEKPQEIDLTKDSKGITWEKFSDQIKINISNKNASVILSIGKDSARQLKQALSNMS